MRTDLQYLRIDILHLFLDYALVRILLLFQFKSCVFLASFNCLAMLCYTMTCYAMLCYASNPKYSCLSVCHAKVKILDDTEDKEPLNTIYRAVDC